MTLHRNIPLFICLIAFSLAFLSCDDKSENEGPTLSKYQYPVPPPVIEDQTPKTVLALPAVDSNKIKQHKARGKYGHSDFFHYLNSHFNSNGGYTQEGMTPDFEIVTFDFENDIEYESSIHEAKPKHFVESTILPNADLEDVKKTLSSVYSNIEFDCGSEFATCEYSSYGTEEVMNIYLYEYESYIKVGITRRKKYR